MIRDNSKSISVNAMECIAWMYFYRYRLSICTLLIVLIVIIQDIDYSRHVYTLICSVTYMTFFGNNFSGVGYISVNSI